MSTQAYVDLMFAWGRARLGDAPAARALMAEAESSLRVSPGPAHLWLLDAFTFRIEQANAGQPHGASWPALLQSRLNDLRNPPLRWAGPADCYIVDRLRSRSRILEPFECVNPYAFLNIPGVGNSSRAPESRPRQIEPVTLEELHKLKHPMEIVSAVGEHFKNIAWEFWPQAIANVRAILHQLPRVPNTLTTAQFYSRFHLMIVENTILAIVGNDVAGSSELTHAMTPAEIASRREALGEVRAKLIEWGQPDW